MFTEKDDNKNEVYLMTSCSNDISFFQVSNEEHALWRFYADMRAREETLFSVISY
jgi:hypothetical protein